MRIKRAKLEQLQQRGKATLVSGAKMVVAPVTPVETAPEPVPTSKKKWRFDVNRDWDGYITNVIATEL
jgi:hypothetical protein